MIEELDRTKDYQDDESLEALVTEIFPVHLPLLQPARYKCEYGGRGSAKTRTFVAILLNNVQYYGWRLVCFREIMKSLDDSVYQEFVDEIYRTPGREKFFSITKGSIICNVTGGRIKFDGLFRNQQKLKGYAGFDAAWVEEAENVTAESWKFLIPTLRKNGSEIWVSYNPDDPLSATHTMFVTGRTFPDYTQVKDPITKELVFNPDGSPKMRRYCVVIKVNYTENPRFPEELRIDMELMKENDYELYLHVYEGEPVSNSDLAVIKPIWVSAAVDAHIKLGLSASGSWDAGFDVADEGKDKNAFVWHHGIVVKGAVEWKDDDPNTAARRVFHESLDMGMDTVTYDNIGVGAGAKGAIREEKRALSIKRKCPQYRGFTANESPLNPEADYAPGKKNIDMFRDLKAQAWWLVRDRFKNTYDAINGKPYDPEKIISFDSESEFLPPETLRKLMAELSQPRRDLINGKVFIESKKDMRKRGVMSPNLADGLIMSYAPETGFKLENLI
jgi:phage terminase large subunit